MLIPTGAPGLRRLMLIALCAVVCACSWPSRSAVISEVHGELEPLPGFENVRAIDGYPSEVFQTSFNQAMASFAQTPMTDDGRRDFDVLVLSSGGANGAFGAGILTAWSQRGDRPEFWLVTGVSVGGLLAPFVYAGPEFDHRIEELFRRIDPRELHREKSALSAVLWDESLMDNAPLRERIDTQVDRELMEAMAAVHATGRRCYVGSTNLDSGDFVIWDLGAIATRRSDAALDLLRSVLAASAAIPVVYPPVRFSHGERDELHADGAIIRPFFIPRNVVDDVQSVEGAGLDWTDVDATLYVVHNGSLRPRPVTVQRETLEIAMRTVTMMSYTMVSEHLLQIYVLSRAWGAGFRFLTLPDGLELSVNAFTPEDTERLFLLGQGLMEREEAWSAAPPGYVITPELRQIAPVDPDQLRQDDSVEARLDRIEEQLRELMREMRDRR